MRRCLVAFVALGLLSQVHVWLVASFSNISRSFLFRFTLPVWLALYAMICSQSSKLICTRAPGQALKGPLWAFDSCTETLGSQIFGSEF